MEGSSPFTVKITIWFIGAITLVFGLLHHFNLVPYITEHVKIEEILIVTQFFLLSILAVIFEKTNSTHNLVEEFRDFVSLSDLEKLERLKDHIDKPLASVAGTHINHLIDRTIHVFRDRMIELDDIELFMTIYKNTLNEFRGSEFYATSIAKEEFFWRNQTIEGSI